MSSRYFRISSDFMLCILTRSCLLIILANCVALFFKHVLGHNTVKGLVPLFHLNFEQNVPTFFSIFLLLLASILCFCVARITERDSLLWKILSIVFLFLSFDEFASIHERLISPTREAFHATGFFYFSWIIPYSIIVLFLMVVYARWLFRFPSRVRILLIASVGLYLSGAVVLEGLQGWYFVEIYGGKEALFDFMTTDAPFDLLATLEETCEMFGVVIFVYALTLHIEHDLGGIRLSIGA